MSIFFIGSESAYPDSYFVLNYFNSKHKNNFSQANNKKIDSLLKKCTRTNILSKRIAYYKEINEILKDEAYVIPVFSGDEFDGYFQRWVNGVHYPSTAFYHMQMKYIRIDEKQKRKHLKTLTYKTSKVE
jgi:ABC-type oligopeptide transport system substrate-binding subunit